SKSSRAKASNSSPVRYTSCWLGSSSRCSRVTASRRRLCSKRPARSTSNSASRRWALPRRPGARRAINAGFQRHSPTIGKNPPGIYRSKPMLKTVDLPSVRRTDGKTMRDVPKPLHAMAQAEHSIGPNRGTGGEERQLAADVRSAERPCIEIDEALRKGWFELWYQPKIDLKRKCLAGAEALARMHHPPFGVLPPGTFLPGVTETSVADLARHALVATLQAWPKFDDAGFNLQLAVNIPVSALFSLPIPQLV